MLVFIYLILGYWAAGRTIYKNYVMIGTFTDIFMRKLIAGLFLGWILIPLAIISVIVQK